MRTMCIFTVALFACLPAPAVAQEASPSPSPTPTSTASPAGQRITAKMTVPKGWVSAQNDGVSTIVYRSQYANQNIRIALIRHDNSFTIDEGLRRIRAMLSRFPFPKTEVSETTVCGGREPAVLAIAQDEHGQTLMEQIAVMGESGGVIISYEILDAHPDPAAEAAIRSVCIP